MIATARSASLALVVATATLYGSTESQTTGISATVTRREDGNYVVKYSVGTSQREFVFEPATKLKAYIHSEVTRRSNSTEYEYRYTAANGENSQQQLSSLSVNVTLPKASAVASPDGWHVDIVEAASRISWYRRATSWSLEGIPPGQELRGFAIVTEMLPAPGDARVRGNVWAPQVSSDVPTEAIAQLDELLKHDYLVVHVLAPLIPPGANEPELGPAVLVSRIRGRYQTELYRSGRLDGALIDQALREAIQFFEGGVESRGREALNKARALAAVEVADPWQATLGRGLTITIDHVLRRFEP